MKTNIVEASGRCRLEVRALSRESFTEFHITAAVDGPARAGEAAADLFEQLAAVLVERGIQPIQEKLYGYSRVRDEVMKRRDAIYRQRGLDRAMPVTWIEGAPLRGGDFAGLQLWGVAASDGEPCVETVACPAAGRARLWRGRGFRMLHVPGVRGTTLTGSLAEGRAAQAAQMFANAAAALESHGLKFADVARTWIYVRHLLDWYGDLNRVRTAFYRQVGFAAASGGAFPASTGIMGHSDDEECVMDVLAVRSDTPGAVVAAPVRRSPRQDSSFNYGSAFSRGMVFEIEGRRTVHVSGTASINAAGTSTHVGDAEHQSLDTLMSIAAILEAQGGGLRSITSATLFCKDRAAGEAWERATTLLQLPTIPKISIIADVCRPDLLVEMEAVATI